MAEVVAGTVFEYLWRKLRWQEIPNCPGRFILTQKEQECLQEPKEFFDHVFGTNNCLKQHCSAISGPFQTEIARDLVFVCHFQDRSGGLISYKHPNGTFLHTLNNPSGLIRKLTNLGLPLPQ